MLVFEEAERRIQEVGGFSTKLEEVLLYMLKDSKDIRDTMVKENEAMKAESEKRLKEMEKQFQVILFDSQKRQAHLNPQDDTSRLKEIIKKENEERQRDMKDIEGFVKKENADRKRETQEISDKMTKEEERRCILFKLLTFTGCREQLLTILELIYHIFNFCITEWLKLKLWRTSWQRRRKPLRNI